MKGWMKVTLLILIILVAVGSYYYLIFSSIFKGAPPISRESFLELNIYGEVPERGSIEPIARILSGEQPSIEGILQCIRKAAIDPKIVGIVLRPLGSTIGWAKTEELRGALLKFKDSGKPVYVYLEMGGNREYYLSLVGDMVFGSPMGSLFINGFLGGSYFFRGTLEKIGVEADFVAYGKYKNAPDIFTRKSMSRAQREVLNSILDDYYPRYIRAISSARNLDENYVRQSVDRGLFTLQDAYKKQLIDTLLYFNEFKDYLKEKNNRRARFVSYSRYKKVPFSKLGVKAKNTIALIYGIGNIVSGIGDDIPEEGLITSESMANSIRNAAGDKSVKAIVLRINSPGGSGIASDIIWREVVEAHKKKPVVVSMSDVAASGGYYIAMAADSILAQPSSIVGSIGVFAGKFSLKGLYEKLGITKEEIPRGANADIFSEMKKFSIKQRQLIQDGIEDFYKEFVNKVAEGRNLTYDEIDIIARGRVWTGTQALKNGLIDRLGGLNEAIQVAKKMAGIPSDAYVKLKIYPKRRSFLNRLLSSGFRSNLNFVSALLPLEVSNYLCGILYFRDYEPLLIIPFYPIIR